jgi:IS5 family transposase
VLEMRSMPGNPYDGHTLADALQQVETLTDQRPSLVMVDRGYRGHGVQDTKVITPRLVRLRSQAGLTHDRILFSNGPGFWPS